MIAGNHLSAVSVSHAVLSQWFHFPSSLVSLSNLYSLSFLSARPVILILCAHACTRVCVYVCVSLSLSLSHAHTHMHTKWGSFHSTLLPFFAIFTDDHNHGDRDEFMGKSVPQSDQPDLFVCVCVLSRMNIQYFIGCIVERYICKI